MTTTTFEDKDTRYAYNCIHDFFDNFGFSDAVTYIGRVLKVALSNKAWKKPGPYNVIYFIEKLEELSSAAFIIDCGQPTRPEAILEETANGDPDMRVQQHYTGGHPFRSTWDYFPRNLTAGQYHNPYKAITKFTGYMTEAEWKKALKEIAEYALSNSKMIDEQYPYNILTLRLRLMQLIEGCHLLQVRTNIKKAEPKQKRKK